MKTWIGLGSNLGDRRQNLEMSAQFILSISGSKSFRVSSIYQTEALVPDGAPKTWDIPYLNAVLEIDWDSSSLELLQTLKKIEHQVGRMPGEKWAPRLIDLDILLQGEKGEINIDEQSLQVPHPHMKERAFVLDPLSELLPALRHQARRLKDHAPQWMSILNLTPDSFSDGGEPLNLETFPERLVAEINLGLSYLDFGAESTRPNAQRVEPDMELERLKVPVEILQKQAVGKVFSPKWSVDTRNFEVAKWALAQGAGLLNDVSGLSDLRFLELFQDSSCEYILMHSLSIPTDPSQLLSDDFDPVLSLKTWAEEKLQVLRKAGISMDRIIFDPGIGFGKSARQSREILQRIAEFQDLPVRIMVGHSRKSFLNLWGERPPQDRDLESIAVSLQLAKQGVDILRVHAPEKHLRAFYAFRGVSQ